jgi:uncharacterized membrane protein YfcA
LIALLLALVGASAGLLGSLMGVGGGILVIPALSEGLGVPFREAVAVSLVVIIANSSASAAVYVDREIADLRVAVVLELATVAGAVAGSAVAGVVPVKALKLLFAAVALYSAVTLWRRRHGASDAAVVGAYEVKGWAPGLAVSGAAGALSGLLGIGGGVFKMPAMTLLMGIPFKIAAATSNFMIGVTAAASAYVYWARGDVNAELAAPVVVGVFAGSRLGTSLLAKLPARRLQAAFAGVVALLAGRMVWTAIGGGP